MVTTEDFLNVLRKEIEYFQDGGTVYRQTTAKMALEIARVTNDLKPFLDRDTSRKTVVNVKPELERDEERREDLAKYLNVIARDLTLEIPQEIVDYIKERRKTRGKIRLNPPIK